MVKDRSQFAAALKIPVSILCSDSTKNFKMCFKDYTNKNFPNGRYKALWQLSGKLSDEFEVKDN